MERNHKILDQGLNLTLRPMKYPQFYDHYKNAIANTWSVEEISFNTDIADIRDKLTPAEKHVLSRIVSFFASADNIVNENIVLSLYKHVNSPEVRMYYSRQIFEESLHIQCYLTFLDNYLPNDRERFEAFDAINKIPSIKKKAEFCFKWMDAVNDFDKLDTNEKRQTFLLNLITFAGAIEGLFFFGAFAYVYYLRSRGLLHGLASGTNWIFRDESLHMNVAFEIVDIIRQEYPDLWTKDLEDRIVNMFSEAIDCEYAFAEDVLQLGVAGFSKEDMKSYLKYVADSRLVRLGLEPIFDGKNPFKFLELQDVASHTNFFERVTTDYQKGATVGKVAFTDDF
jgi:ribonucleoside-diphosphate reductase beta chain